MTDLKPYPYQKIGIFRMDHRFRGKALNSDDVGLGKSVQALMASIPYRQKRPLIIVCPASCKYQWETEVKKWIPKWRCWILEGRYKHQKLPLDIPEVIILNWDILESWQDFITSLKPNVLIGDEIHNIKNRGSRRKPVKRTKAFRAIARKVKYVYGLSGTPFENKPAELYTILNVLRKDMFPNFVSFGNRYCDPKPTPFGVTYEGATRKKELNRLLKRNLMVRRTKEQVLKDLPPIRRSIVPIVLPPKEMSEYEEAEKNIVRWLFKNKPSKALRSMNAVHLTRMNHLLSLISELKYDQVAEWIDDFLENNDEKLAVFGHHRKLLRKLHERYKNQSVLVYGGIKGRKRQLAIDSFVSNKGKRLFIGGIKACGEGMNKLQTVCSYMAILELVWNPMKITQVEGRLHRLLQRNRVMVFYLITRKTVEGYMANALMRKERIFKAIMDGKFTGSMEFDIFKSVIRHLERKK